MSLRQWAANGWLKAEPSSALEMKAKAEPPKVDARTLGIYA